jgi:EAL domain-containing protein (putative c-di-GMP-specific phosphodiesterase class I)
VVQLEALARWTRDGVPVSPAEFIPLAEQTGLIRRLTEVVVRKSLSQLRAWTRDGADVSVAVNISPCSLRDPSLVTTIGTAIDDAGIAADRVTLEITESAFADHTDTVVRVLDELRALGVRLSIDDFGSGYSSMAYLKRLPIDELKIDRAFITDLDSDPRDVEIVRAIACLAKSLGLLVVAEGIESGTVGGSLADLGCDRGQGYAIARPATATEVLLSVHDGTGHDVFVGAGE